ncbi:hypothetical protein BB934_32460 (plasmid) [Microvirga ossetica]|uniref:LysR substrate-binding domain-containing protein n=1 Tax=Microvirga ossetica TaxID=1882682 RepID=A0A1B2ESI4_9HYPH|nr:LysR substrate-binding domain-containing protein [Microvirga ossetica]ANY82935.1 hypothetical protein BB934_32460 [Microvirga ossetica]
MAKLKLRVATFNALSLSFIGHILTTFLERKPGISVFHETEGSRAILDLVASREFDFGIVQLSGDYPGIDVVPLPSVPAVCVLPLGHPLEKKRVIKIGDLQGQKLIALGRNSPLRIRVDSLLSEAGVTCDKNLETTLAASACDLVSRGVGIAILDPFTVSYYGNTEIVVRQFTPNLPYEIALVFPAKSARPVLATEFEMLVREMMKLEVDALSQSLLISSSCGSSPD